MEEIKLVKSRKYEDKIKEYNLRDIERHEQEVLEKARKYQEYKDELSRKNLIIRLWHRILEALRVNHSERNFINNPWHTIQETESDKWEIAYFYNHRKKTLNFDNIFHLQSGVLENKSKSRFLNFFHRALATIDKIIFGLSFIYICSALIHVFWETIQTCMNFSLQSILNWVMSCFAIVMMLLLCGGLLYLFEIRSKRTKKWKVAQDAKWIEKLAILIESSNNWLRQNSREVLYICVLWVGVAIVFRSETIEWWPIKYYMRSVDIYCIVSLIVIFQSFIFSPIGFFTGLVFLGGFLLNVNLWTGITLLVALWITLLTKEFWMLSYSRKVPEYIINPTDNGSRIIEANLLKIKVYTSIGVLITYYLIALVDKYQPYYNVLLFFGRSSEEGLKDPYKLYQNLSYLVDRLMVLGFVIMIMLIIKESYTASMKGAIRDIIDSSISSLYYLIYRGVNEVEKPIFKEKVGLSIAYLDKINPIQLLENSEALPKGIQVLVEGTDDPHKRKVVVIMPDLTVHSGIVEFEP